MSWIRLALLLVLLALSCCSHCSAGTPAPAPAPAPAAPSQPSSKSASQLASSARSDLTTSNDEIDCAVKQLALSYAQKLFPTSEYVTNSVHEALQLENQCGIALPFPATKHTTIGRTNTKMKSKSESGAVDTIRLFVDPTNGNDMNSGTIDAPVASIERAVQLSRQRDVTMTTALIELREGTHYLNDTIRLTSTDSRLTIQAFETEHVKISGARLLSNLNWTSQNNNNNNNNNILVADLPADLSVSIDNFNTFFVNGRRAIRARYPNGNPETMGLHTEPSGWLPAAAAEAWLPPVPFPPAVEISISTPQRNGTNFPTFQLGFEGVAAVFTPPYSFWATADPPAGGTYQVPSGVQLKADSLSNRTHEWTNVERGIVHALHDGHWGSWMFQMSEFNVKTNTISFSRGGFQEARGSSRGGEFYIDNIFEELDSPMEWYVDPVQMKLYFYPNQTVDLEHAVLEASALETLITVTGTIEEPATEIQLKGITFTGTASTFMKSYEVPSGGDWSLHRDATVRLKGTINTVVTDCIFDSVGGNALIIDGYNFNTLILQNEFKWIGDSAILVVGTVSLMDGVSDRNQPDQTIIQRNFIHEVGIWAKQTAPIMQALARNTLIDSNIAFNCPRAGITFNDGFAGGHMVSHNLLFNTVRETGDHGPFNSWDRQPYLTLDSNGIPSLLPSPTQITRNLFINNYHATWPIDHDDGSCYYVDTYNYLVYGGWKSYLGHSKVAHHNVYILPDAKSPPFWSKQSNQKYHTNEDSNKDSNSNSKAESEFESESVSGGWGQYCLQNFAPSKGRNGWNESWCDNICAMASSGNVYSLENCDVTDLQDLMPFTTHNMFYVPQPIVLQCGANNYTLQQFAAFGYEVGSVQNGPATIEQMIEWGKQLLWP